MSLPMDVEDARLTCGRCEGEMVFEGKRMLEDVTPLRFRKTILNVTIMKCQSCGCLEMFDQATFQPYLNESGHEQRERPNPQA